MGSIRTRAETGLLFFDFRYQGLRCREQTLLSDSKANRTRAQQLLDRIEEEIAVGTFDYGRYFPNSKQLGKLNGQGRGTAENLLVSRVTGMAPAQSRDPERSPAPRFSDFADLWMQENEVVWRRTQRKTVKDIVSAPRKAWRIWPGARNYLDTRRYHRPRNRFSSCSGSEL